jgi:NAD(P)-dependent dehydrogenase (short-subunit alcohol dehydrogenase family)
MSDAKDFRGRSVFVAGGTSGINLGIAEAFALAGANVMVMSRSEAKVKAAVEHIKHVATGIVIGQDADVRNYDATSAALGKAGDAFGELDVVVSGAAGNFPASASVMSANAFKAVVDIDLLGTFNVVRAAHEFIRKPGGLVLNISAPQAGLPMVLQAHACAAKAGVEMLTRVLAWEWGPQGIRVNAVVPGPIQGTEGMERLAPTPEARDVVTDSVPLGRWGTPGDVANACLLLASPFASFITGAVLAVDGGWSLGGATIAMTAIARQRIPGIA